MFRPYLAIFCASRLAQEVVEDDPPATARCALLRFDDHASAMEVCVARQEIEQAQPRRARSRGRLATRRAAQVSLAKRPDGPIATTIAAAPCAAAVTASLVAPVATSASFATSARGSPSTSTDAAPRSM